MRTYTSLPLKEYLDGQCQWYLMCDNQATHTQAHPILGDVPICDRCQALYDQQSTKG